MTLAHAIPRHAEGRARRAWQGKYQRANKNRKPCIAVASLRVLAAPLCLLLLLLFLPHVAVCEKLRLAFWACFSFGADIYFAVVNFKLPSHFATCNLPHAPCHLPLACHAAIGRAVQRSATSPSIPTSSSWLNMHY